MSFLPLLTGSTQPNRSALIHHSATGKFAIRQDQWVYIDAPLGADSAEPETYRRLRILPEENGPAHLYDLGSGGGQRRSVLAERPEVAAELRNVLEHVRITPTRQRVGG